MHEDSGTSKKKQIELGEIVDLQAVKELLNDSDEFCRLPVSIFNNDEKAMLPADKPEVCRRFHETHPETRENCALCGLRPPPSQSLPDYQLVQCEYGLYQAASQVVINDLILGTIVVGPLFTETPDMTSFRGQAKNGAFPEKEYLAAVEKIPVVDKTDLSKKVRYLFRLLHLLGNNGLQIHHQKQIEKTCLGDEGFISQVFAQSTTSFCMFHSDGSFYRVNQAFCHLFGIIEEDIDFNRFTLFDYYKTFNPQLLPIVKDVFEKKKAATWVYQLSPEEVQKTTRSASELKNELYLEVFAFPIMDNGGELKYVVLQHRDLTEQKRSEKSLEEKEEIFRIISEQFLMGIAIIQDGGNVYCNKVVETISGYTVDELLNFKLEDMINIVHPDDREFAIDQMLKKQSGEKDIVAHHVYRSIAKDGQIKWIENYSKPITYNGRPANLRTTLDITDRKTAEMALKQSEEKYRNVVDNAIESICILYQEKFVYFNPAALRLFEYSREEMETIDPQTLVHPEDRPMVKSRRKAREKGEPVPHNYSYRIIAKSGAVKWVDLKSVAITWQDNPAILAFHSDITEKKRSEELMIQTEKMTSIGNLAAGTAHELNNPLGGILQGVQNISRRLSPGLKANQKAAEESGIDLNRLQQYLDRRGIPVLLKGILDSGKKAAGIISNMLQFSRKSESTVSIVNLGELIEETIELAGMNYDLKKKQDFRSMTVVREIEPGLPDVPCSKTEIEQVVLNLLNNAAWAMAHMSQDRPHVITIRIRVEGEMACIEVSDNGPGIEADKLKRIFDPFYTTKPEGEGTGLGLSVSYTIITNNHNGTMEVESNLGQGTTFIVRLPLTRENIETPPG